MTQTQRDAISNTARAMVAQVQAGDVQGLRSATIPPVAEAFDGIAGSAGTLKPLLQNATLAIYDLYALDAADAPAAGRTDFFCGNPVVVVNFTDLPPGQYALVLFHATGVQQPQQISLILSRSSANRWLLAGFYRRPMVEAGHTGIWYWVQAREYAQKNMNWNAWLFYQRASYLLAPVDFVSSAHLQKLQTEAERVRPTNLSSAKPLVLDAHGVAFLVADLHTTSAFRGLDLEVDYVPDASRLAQLHDPVAARRQAVSVMTALLAAYPELRIAFDGIWARAFDGNSSAYALDLPMDQIAEEAQPAVDSSASNGH